MVVRLLKDLLGVPVVYFGGVVVSEVARRGLDVTEATEREVREELRATHGMSAIAHLASREIDEHFGSHQEIIIDGLYSYAEYELLDERYPGMLNLIAVHAPRAVREQRLKNRPVRPLTPAEIHSRDMREIRTLDKATAIALADFHIVNDSSVSDLRDHVSRTITSVHESRGTRAFG